MILKNCHVSLYPSSPLFNISFFLPVLIFFVHQNNKQRENEKTTHEFSSNKPNKPILSKELSFKHDARKF